MAVTLSAILLDMCQERGPELHVSVVFERSGCVPFCGIRRGYRRVIINTRPCVTVMGTILPCSHGS